MDSFKWISCWIENKTYPLSNHTCAGIYNYPIETIELIKIADHFKVVEAAKPMAANQVAVFMEGIYIFGGKDGKGRARNDLYIVKTENTKKYHFECHVPIGKGPAARYGHAMIYFQPKQSLVIYGGRNDALWEEYHTCCFSDIWMLNVTYLSWCKVQADNFKTPRYCMSYFMDGILFILFLLYIKKK